MTPVAPRSPRRISRDDLELFGFLGLVLFGVLFIIALGLSGHLF